MVDVISRTAVPVVLVLVLGSPWLAMSAAGEEEAVLAAYFVEWGVWGRDYHVTNIPAAIITHVNYAFADPVRGPGPEEASLRLYDAYAAVSNTYPGDAAEDPPFRGTFNQLVKLKAQRPHVRTLISVGGWTLSTDFSDIAASPSARTSFVESCVGFVTNYQFDGIDVDWEYPVEGGAPGTGHRPEDADNYLLLVREIRDRLDQQESIDGKRYLLTIATPATHNSLTNRFRISDMAQYLDWINVMAYDMTGPWDSVTGHNAPLKGNAGAQDPDLNVDTVVATYVGCGVPAGKLVLGLSYYGRSFTNVPGPANGLFQSHGGAGPGTWEAGLLDFRDIDQNYVATGGYGAHRDDISEVPYLYDPTSRVFVSYDDASSISLKARYARGQGLRGTMCWSIDGDSRDRRLQRAAYRAFRPLVVSGVDLDAERDLRMSWDAILGEQYAVEWTTTLVGAAWVGCTSLLDSTGHPVGVITGYDGTISVTDTNCGMSPAGFYRLHTTDGL